jgi:hypothetical protein
MDDICKYLIEICGRVEEDDLNSMSPMKFQVEAVGVVSTRISIVTDQSGLLGLMRHLHNLGLVFLSVQRMATGF